MNWIETHGFEVAFCLFGFSMVTSVMPPLPVGQGWWVTWLYNVVQIFGANAGKLAQHDPRFQQVTKFSMSGADGSETTSEIRTAKV